MSTIIDALKKAQKEEAIRQERNADRVVWVSTESGNKWFLPVGAGFLFAVLVLMTVWLFFSDSPEETRMTQAQNQTGLQPKIKTEKNTVIREKALLPEGKPINRNLVLSGIVWDAREPIALINSSSLKIGDSISGSRVVSISQDEVELSSQGETWTLSLE